MHLRLDDNLTYRATKSRVLVVEDDPDSADAISRVLERQGYDVEAARTLAEGLDILKAHEPTHVILDLRLPDGSGAELLRHIREQELPVRVAVATGTADADLKADAVLLRPDAILTKPLDYTDLVLWLSSSNPLPDEGAAGITPLSP